MKALSAKCLVDGRHREIPIGALIRTMLIPGSIKCVDVCYTDSGFQRNASIIFAQPRRIIILAEPEFKTDVFLHELFGELELECHVTGRTLRRRPASVSDVARL